MAVVALASNTAYMQQVFTVVAKTTKTEHHHKFCQFPINFTLHILWVSCCT